MAVSANLDIYIRAYDEVTATLKAVANDLKDLVSSIKQVGTQSQTTSKDVTTLADATLKAGSSAEKAAEQEMGLFRSLENLVGGVRNLAYAFAGLAFVKFLKDMADASARTEVLATVLHQVARNAGISEEEIDRTDKAVQKLGITAASSRQAITQLIQADIFKPDQIRKYATELARASQDLAVISGWDSSSTFSRLIVNINQMDTMGLRWMGIIINREQVFAEAAQKLNKELSQNEKKLAFTNAALAEAAKLSGVYELAMNDVGKQLTSLPRLFEEVKVAIGDYLLPAYSALVLSLKEFLENMGKAVGENNKFSSGAQTLAAAVKLLADQFFALVEVLVSLKDILFLIGEIYVFNKLIAFGSAAIKIFNQFGASIAAFGQTLARVSAGIGLILGGALGKLGNLLGGLAASLNQAQAGVGAALGNFFQKIGLQIGAFAATLFSNLGKVLARILPYIGSAILAFNLVDYLIEGTDWEPLWVKLKSEIDNIFKQAKLYFEKGKRAIGLGSDESVVEAQLAADQSYLESLKTTEERRVSLKKKSNSEILESFRQSKTREIELEEELRTVEDSTRRDAIVEQLKTVKNTNAKTLAKLNELEATKALSSEEVKLKQSIQATDLEAVRRSKAFAALKKSVGETIEGINADFAAITTGVSTKLSSTVSGYVTVVNSLLDQSENASFAIDELAQTFEGLGKKANPKELELITDAIKGLIPKLDPANVAKLNEVLTSLSQYKTDSLVRENEKLTLSFDRVLKKISELQNSLREQYRIASDLSNAQKDLDASVAASRGNNAAQYEVEARKRREAIEDAKLEFQDNLARIEKTSQEVSKQINLKIGWEEAAQEKIYQESLKRIDAQYSVELKKIKDTKAFALSDVSSSADKSAQREITALITAREELRTSETIAAADRIKALEEEYQSQKKIAELKVYTDNLLGTIPEKEAALKEEDAKAQEILETKKESERQLLVTALKRIDEEFDTAIERVKELQNARKQGLTADNPLYAGFEGVNAVIDKERGQAGNKDQYQEEIDNLNKLRDVRKKAAEEERKESSLLMRLKEQLVQNEKSTNAERIVSLQQYQKKLLAALKEAEEAYKRHIAKLDSLKKEQESLALRQTRDLLELDSGTISKEEELRRNEKVYRQERTRAEIEYAKAVLQRQDSSMDKAKELYEAQITDAKRLATQAKERGDLYSFSKYRRDIEGYYSVLEKINRSQQKEEGTALDKAKKDIADLTAEADRLTGELIGKIGLALLDLGTELLIDVDATYLQNSILLAITAQQYVIDVQARVNGLPGQATIAGEEPTVKLNKYYGTPEPGYESYYAGGGMVQGAGTDTSDNLLAWLSPNEFVLRAKAVKNIVREYGINTLNYINEFGRFPKFALGGLVERIRELPSLLSIPAPHVQLMTPVLAGGGPVTSAPLTPMHFHFPGAELTARGTSPEVDAFKRYLAKENLKRGRK